MFTRACYAVLTGSQKATERGQNHAQIRINTLKGRVHDVPGFLRLHNSEPSMGRDL